MKVEFCCGRRRAILHGWRILLGDGGAKLMKRRGQLARALNRESLREFLAGKPIAHGQGRTIRRIAEGT